LNLTELLQAARAENGRVVATVGEDWLQGRSLFGGVQAAIGWRAMRTLVPAEMPLRTLQMTFIAPIEQGEVIARAQVLRAGKNTMHIEARFGADDATQAVMLCVFGNARESIVRRNPSPPPPISERRPVPFVRGRMPSFMQQFEANLVGGAGPFSGKAVNEAAFELSLRDPGPLSEAHLLVLADFVPPVALSWMTKPVPGSSLTWMFELLDPDFASQPLTGWRAISEIDRGARRLHQPDHHVVCARRHCRCAQRPKHGGVRISRVRLAI
jgi:acyl-coenzyme A thioesterase PaaI-like protein